MAKILKITFPEKCIGCELCVSEVQRQLGKYGLEGSPIRIFRNPDNRSIFGQISFEIHMDNDVQELNITKIKDVCPTGVFTIESVEKLEEKVIE